MFLLRYTFQASVHAIWREINRCKHGEKELPYTLLPKTIDKMLETDYLLSRDKEIIKIDAGM